MQRLSLETVDHYIANAVRDFLLCALAQKHSAFSVSRRNETNTILGSGCSIAFPVANTTAVIGSLWTILKIITDDDLASFFNVIPGMTSLAFVPEFSYSALITMGFAFFRGIEQSDI